MRKRVGGIILACLVGCGNVQMPPPAIDVCSEVKQLSSQQQQLEVMAKAIDSKYRTGLINQDTYIKAKSFYNSWALDQSSVIVTDLMVINNSNGKLTNSAYKYEQNSLELEVLIADFINEYDNGTSAKITLLESSTPCPITNDQIKSILTPIQWEKLGNK